MQSNLPHNSIVIGSGPAGLTAALYLARADLSPVVIAGQVPGGQLMLTDIVENYPGFPDGITGVELIDRMTKQAERFGATLVYQNAIALDVERQPFQVTTTDGIYQSRVVVLATGSASRWLGVPGEKELIGKGVSSCAVCDAPLFRDKNVVVVGGGDSAMEEALALSKFANMVTIIHRRDTFKASRIMQERVKANQKINVRWNAQVVRVAGQPLLSEIVVRDVVSGAEEIMKVDGLFVAIGHEPASAFIKGTIDLDAKGYIKVIETKTSVPGIFVAGDVHDYHYKQAVTAAGFGCMAALEAEKWINSV